MQIDAHPLLHTSSFSVRFSAPLSSIPSPPSLLALLTADAPSPFSLPDDALRAAVRDMLRHGGFKPTGRSKPASEYLVKAAEGGFLGPINPAVDACNVVSLHSGLPISIVDLDRAREPLRIGLAAMGANYVFNASGQAIDVGGLVCVHDADGPCANAVKDAQRTKTTPESTRMLCVVWGVVGYESRVAAAAAWYRELLSGLGGISTEA